MKKLSIVMGLLFALVMVFLYQSQSASAHPGISNITCGFDGPFACTVTVTWTTHESTDDNVLKWDGDRNCNQSPTYPNEETASDGTFHVVTFSAVGIPDKIAIKVVSDGEESDCQLCVINPICIGE